MHARRTFTNPDQGTQALIAYLAYRAKHGEGASDQEAHEAAVAAVQSLLSLPWKEACAEAVNTIAYAIKYHSEWFWRGVSE